MTKTLGILLGLALVWLTAWTIAGYAMHSAGSEKLALVEHISAPATRLERGAEVRVQVSPEGPIQIRQIGVGGFLAETELGAHFGLGAGVTSVHEVRVRWPASGQEQVFTEVAINQRMLALEP